MTRTQILNLIEKKTLNKLSQNPGVVWDDVVYVVSSATDEEKEKFIDAVNRKDSDKVINIWNDKLNQMIKAKAKSVRDEWDSNQSISIEDLGEII